MHVPLDGAGGDEQPGCYLLIGEALSDQLEHLSLSRSEREVLGQGLILPWDVPARLQWVGARVWRLELRKQTPHVAVKRVLACVTESPASRLKELREQG